MSKCLETVCHTTTLITIMYDISQAGFSIHVKLQDVMTSDFKILDISAKKIRLSLNAGKTMH